MTLQAAEFIRRFLLHVLPHGFHRIRHYGLFANGGRAENLARARELLNVEAPPVNVEAPPDHPLTEPHDPAQSITQPCPNCGGSMIVIDTFEPGQEPHRPRSRAPPTAEAQAA